MGEAQRLILKRRPFLARHLDGTGLELETRVGMLDKGKGELMSPRVALFLCCLFILLKFNFASAAAGDALHVRTRRK